MIETQPQLLGVAPNPNDVVYTPDWLAKDIIDHFTPVGVCLDPCMGDGAFFRHLPSGAEWCEIERGRDFYSWMKPVDWIITNPPFSDYFRFMEHAFEVSKNVVYLLPFHKIFQSLRNLKLIYRYGGVKEIYCVGTGTMISWGVGFAIGAIHFQSGYSGGIEMSFRDGVIP